MQSFREWFEENLGESAEDIANFGADSGFPHITYTREAAELFDRFGHDIWEMAYEMAESLGEKSVPAMVAGFRRADMADSLDGFKNLMVWFACEQIAREMVDAEEEEEEEEEEA